MFLKNVNCHPASPALLGLVSETLILGFSEDQPSGLEMKPIGFGVYQGPMCPKETWTEKWGQAGTSPLPSCRVCCAPCGWEDKSRPENPFARPESSLPAALSCL